MTDIVLTRAEVAILLVLMAEAQPVSNNELYERYKFKIDKAQRTRLNDVGLVESRIVPVPHIHVLTDKGWHYCRQAFAAGRPKGAAGGAVSGAHYAILDGLNRFFEREDVPLAHVFGRKSLSSSGPGDEPAGVVTLDGIDARVRAAYRQLARHPGEWVRLSELRPLLGDLAKSEVDTVLKAMDLSRAATLIPEENQKVLTSADRDAAATIGRKANHLIKIEDA